MQPMPRCAVDIIFLLRAPQLPEADVSANRAAFLWRIKSTYSSSLLNIPSHSLVHVATSSTRSVHLGESGCSCQGSGPNPYRYRDQHLRGFEQWGEGGRGIDADMNTRARCRTSHSNRQTNRWMSVLVRDSLNRFLATAIFQRFNSCSEDSSIRSLDMLSLAGLNFYLHWLLCLS